MLEKIIIVAHSDQRGANRDKRSRRKQGGASSYPQPDRFVRSLFFKPGPKNKPQDRCQ